MTNEQLLQLLGEIDEKHLCGANRDIERWLEEQNGVEFKVERPRKKSPWKIIAAVSCSAAAVLGAVFLMSNVLNNGFEHMPGDPSSSVQSGESEFTVNSEVMWAIGKTVGELTERYGEVTMDGGTAYRFKNGYGIYHFNELNSGSCVSLEVNASDLLTGDLSTVNLDNIASKYGFNVIQLEPEDNKPGMDNVYTIANFSHPSYKNITFLMFHKRSGFDEDAKFVVSYERDNSGVTNGEPTFLIGPDGKAILTSEITRLENTDKTAETLTEDDLWADVYCDGFAYYKEPCGIGYDNYKNPELFYAYGFIGEIPEDTNEWKRVNVGDEIFGLKVKSATSHFRVNDWDEYTFPARYYYDNDNGIELEGTIEVEGYLQVYKRTDGNTEISEMMWVFPSTAELPIAPLPIDFADKEEGFKTIFESHSVYDHIYEFFYVGEFSEISLGYFSDADCDMDGLGVGDVAYARVTLSNITCYNNSASAKLEKVELLSDILAHDEDDPSVYENNPSV